ncbi:MAG: trypsin-like peptidase domain-containing protein [Deltaproteobacteria bacterium]|nr:MAG: trypsin-like peptidase domain-containing protein [Deltaproteobacteria bacterium]
MKIWDSLLKVLDKKQHPIGTAWVRAPDGVVITAAHVARKALGGRMPAEGDVIMAAPESGVEIALTIVEVDNGTRDTAVLQGRVDLPGLNTRTIEQSDTSVAAFGYPQGVSRRYELEVVRSDPQILLSSKSPLWTTDPAREVGGLSGAPLVTNEAVVGLIIDADPNDPMRTQLRAQHPPEVPVLPVYFLAAHPELPVWVKFIHAIQKDGRKKKLVLCAYAPADGEPGEKIRNDILGLKDKGICVYHPKLETPMIKAHGVIVYFLTDGHWPTQEVPSTAEIVIAVGDLKATFDVSRANNVDIHLFSPEHNENPQGWLELELHEFDKAHGKTPPCARVFAYSVDPGAGPVDYERTSMSAFLINEHVYRDLRVLQQHLGKRQARSEEAHSIRPPLDKLWPEFLRLQSSIDDWNDLRWSDHIKNAIRREETKYADVFCTDALGPAAWVNPHVHTYLRWQFKRSVRLQSREAFYCAPDLGTALKKKVWRRWFEDRPVEIVDGTGKPYINVVRILRWTEKQMEQAYALRILAMLVHLHDAYWVPLLVVPRADRADLSHDYIVYRANGTIGYGYEFDLQGKAESRLIPNEELESKVAEFMRLIANEDTVTLGKWVEQRTAQDRV